MAIVLGIAACNGNQPGSEDYIDSSNVTPNSTVNPPDSAIDTTAPYRDTSSIRDTTRGGGVGVNTGSGRDTVR